MPSVRKIPASDTGPLWTFCNAAGEEYIISWYPTQKRFTLWEKTAEGLEKIATSSSPLDLRSRIPGYR